MEFTDEQVKDIKQQLIDQVDKLDNPNKESIKEYIQDLDSKSLEDFLKKNNIKVSESGNLEQTEGSEETEKKCIFCSIVNKEISSYVLTENDKSIAILELNPLSRGHSIVLPKKHLPSDKLPKTSMTLAQRLAKKIRKKLKSDDIKIETSNFQGHSFINVIPIYKDIPYNKRKADEKELIELQKKLKTSKRQKRNPKEKNEKSNIEKTDNIPKISFRIP